jgi:hypothetical protein
MLPVSFINATNTAGFSFNRCIPLFSVYNKDGSENLGNATSAGFSITPAVNQLLIRDITIPRYRVCMMGQCAFCSDRDRESPPSDDICIYTVHSQPTHSDTITDPPHKHTLSLSPSLSPHPFLSHSVMQQ